jgi:peptidyl-prolyl cis-trans isomerase SDCCAG10
MRVRDLFGSAEGGDPTGVGDGGESSFGKPFRDELHSRLKFNHRGVLAMANANQADANGSQFFLTLDSCEWLNKKHTIFGKVSRNCRQRGGNLKIAL